MARSLAPESSRLSIEFTHLRAGDKETEQLWSAIETPHPASASGLVSLDSPSCARAQLQSRLAQFAHAVNARDLSAALAALRSSFPTTRPAAQFSHYASRALTGLR